MKHIQGWLGWTLEWNGLAYGTTQPTLWSIYASYAQSPCELGLTNFGSHPTSKFGTMARMDNFEGIKSVLSHHGYHFVHICRTWGSLKHPIPPRLSCFKVGPTGHSILFIGVAWSFLKWLDMMILEVYNHKITKHNAEYSEFFFLLQIISHFSTSKRLNYETFL